MKKEGTGKPQNPDIALDADVRMRELRFEKVPDPEVHFRGNTRRNSVWKSRRENLPDEVQEGVVYRDAGDPVADRHRDRRKPLPISE